MKSQKSVARKAAKANARRKSFVQARNIENNLGIAFRKARDKRIGDRRQEKLNAIALNSMKPTGAIER